MQYHCGFFITGTDTGIGKTYVSRLLADCFAAQRPTTYMKPVQTGCTMGPKGILTAPDLDAVMDGAAVMNGTYEQHAPYRFEPACSPHLAAALAGTTISLEHIRNCYTAIATTVDITIVEGAGGILSPIGETTFIIDLIVYLNLPVILVTTLRLGTLNHTFLTLRVLHESGVQVAGIVLNHVSNDPASFIVQENRRMIKAHTHPTPFLEVPFASSCDCRNVKDFCSAVIKQS